MERADWLIIQQKYRNHKRDETFASDSDRANDTMILLAEICDQIWKMALSQHKG